MLADGAASSSQELSSLVSQQSVLPSEDVMLLSCLQLPNSKHLLSVSSFAWMGG